MATQNEQTAEGAVSDYDRVGGGPAVRAVVDRFYELVLGDEHLAPYFDGTDLVQLKRHQVLLISQVLGGPAQYDGRDLREAHKGLQITPAHYDLVVSYLAQAMQESGVGGEIIARVGEVLTATRQDVVGAGAS